MSTEETTKLSELPAYKFKLNLNVMHFQSHPFSTALQFG